MIKNYVIKLLEQYCRIKKELLVLEYELNHLDLASADEMIEAMTNGAGRCDEWVSGGAISNPTPQIALTYENKYAQLRNDAIMRTKTRMAELTTITRRLEYQVEQLEAYHAALIREHYFEGYSWTELAALKCISKTTLLKQKEAAISSLCEMYELLYQMGLISIPDEKTGK